MSHQVTSLREKPSVGNCMGVGVSAAIGAGCFRRRIQPDTLPRTALLTAENGATRMIPRSHTWRRLPEPGITDSIPGEELVTGKAGAVVIMNTHMWRGGPAYRTDHSRRALHAFHPRNDTTQQQYQKALLRPDTGATLTPLQRRVLALEDAENDRLGSETTRRSGFPK